MNENLKRARENQKQRESLSITLPGYDTAMNTASKILNLTQDDLDELMSVTDESFQVGFFVCLGLNLFLLMFIFEGKSKRRKC
jgi:hypothetical protein